MLNAEENCAMCKTSAAEFYHVKTDTVIQLKESTKKLLSLLEELQSKTHSKEAVTDEPPILENIVRPQDHANKTKELDAIVIEVRKYNDFVIHFNEDTKFCTNTIGEIIKNMRIVKRFLYMGGKYTKNALMFLNEGLNQATCTEKVEIVQAIAFADVCNVFDTHTIVNVCISWPCKSDCYAEPMTKELAATLLYKISQLEEGRRYLNFNSKIICDIKKVIKKKASRIDFDTLECLNMVLELCLCQPQQPQLNLTYSCSPVEEELGRKTLNSLSTYRQFMSPDELFKYMDVLQNMSITSKGKFELTSHLPSMLILFRNMLIEYDDSALNILVTNILNNIVAQPLLDENPDPVQIFKQTDKLFAAADRQNYNMTDVEGRSQWPELLRTPNPPVNPIVLPALATPESSEPLTLPVILFLEHHVNLRPTSAPIQLQVTAANLSSDGSSGPLILGRRALLMNRTLSLPSPGDSDATGEWPGRSPARSPAHSSSSSSDSIGIPLFTLHLCLGQVLESGPVDMWRISPIFQGVGVSMLIAQAVMGIYSIIGLSWIFVYFRDSFITSNDKYKWALPHEYFNFEDSGARNASLKIHDTLPLYFHGEVLQKSTASNNSLGTIKFQVAFNLAVVWMIVFVSLSKGLRSYGKAVYVLIFLPICGTLVLCTKLLTLIPYDSFTNIFTETDWSEFFVDSNLSPAWAVIFYFILIMFGIGQQLAIWHCVITGIMAINAEALRVWETTITFLSCVVGLGIGLLLTTDAGVRLVHFLDYVWVGSWVTCAVQVALTCGVFVVRGRPYSADTVAISVMDFRAGQQRQLYTWRKHSGYWPVWVRQTAVAMQQTVLLAVPAAAFVQTWRYMSKGPPDILDRIQNLYRPHLGPAPAPPPPPRARSPAPPPDPPPKYTPPPSYSTATGARLLNTLRRSFRTLR
ncbi:hypothetical protein MSG28_009791, partial [Choristoneura fumiferana]